MNRWQGDIKENQEKRTGFSDWIVSGDFEDEWNPFRVVHQYWKMDPSAPRHADSQKEVVQYCRSIGASEELTDTAKFAFWIYRKDNPKRAVSPSLRFTILSRDKFTCQYCGRKAPEVELVVDHITPYSKGGRCVESNLTTACVECNAGKGDRTL